MAGRADRRCRLFRHAVGRRQRVRRAGAARRRQIAGIIFPLETGWPQMAKIAKILQPHIDTAFPANVCLLGSVLPNGFAQVTPRGGTMVFDDEHIGLWERGTGSSAENMKDGTKLTIYFRK